MTYIRYNYAMAFNHYAKIRRILEQRPEGWVIRRIDKPTSAKNFKGETIYFAHYYRIYTLDGVPIPYCKFQQIDRLAHILELPVEALPIIDQD